jgi:hypothetical protein
VWIKGAHWTAERGDEAGELAPNVPEPHNAYCFTREFAAARLLPSPCSQRTFDLGQASEHTKYQ